MATETLSCYSEMNRHCEQSKVEFAKLEYLNPVCYYLYHIGSYCILITCTFINLMG